MIRPSWSARRRSLTASGSIARRGRAANSSTSSPRTAAISAHAPPNMPLCRASTLSPRLRQLTSAASQAPCPFAAYKKGSVSVRIIFLRSEIQLIVTPMISPEYRSTAGRCIAASTSSGTVVGPGMARISRPLRTVMECGFLGVVMLERLAGITTTPSEHAARGRGSCWREAGLSTGPAPRRRGRRRRAPVRSSEAPPGRTSHRHDRSDGRDRMPGGEGVRHRRFS